MAEIKINELTAKGIKIAPTDLIEISESDGAGGYVTKSVTGANVVSGLQATLVSGTNIKTINGTTVLGSGDLTIAGGGGGVHVLTTPISNRTYSSRLNSTGGYTTSSGLANTIILYPFMPAKTLTIKNLIMNVAGATASGLLRVLIYSDLNGVPSSKLLESTSFDCSTTGDKTYITSFTFTAGTTYWLGAYSNTSIPFVILELSQCIPLSSTNIYQGFSTLSIAATFPNAPATLGTTTLSTTLPTSIMLTAL